MHHPERRQWQLFQNGPIRHRVCHSLLRHRLLLRPDILGRTQVRVMQLVSCILHSAKNIQRFMSWAGTSASYNPIFLTFCFPNSLLEYTSCCSQPRLRHLHVIFPIPFLHSYPNHQSSDSCSFVNKFKHTGSLSSCQVELADWLACTVLYMLQITTWTTTHPIIYFFERGFPCL